MAWTDIDLARLLKIFDISIPRDIINNCKYLYGQLGSLPQTVQNGGFEVDSDGNGQPDNITTTTYAGGAVAIDATTSAEGSQCLKMTHPGGAGAGGGTAEFDYVPCSDLAPVFVSLVHWATAAGMRNQVVIRWYDKGKLHLSDTTSYDSTANPTTAQLFMLGTSPPAGARFFKVKLIGGYNDTNVAGTAYFDAVRVSGLEVLAGQPVNVQFAEITSGQVGSFADVGSFSVLMPYVGIPCLLSFNCEVQSNSWAVSHFRFRYGSAYSTEMQTTNTIYESVGPFELRFTPATPVVTLYAQAYCESAQGHHIRKIDTTATAKASF